MVFAFDNTMGCRLLAPGRSLRLALQFAIKPPKAQTDNRREDGNNASQNNEGDKAKDDGYSDRQRADNDDEDIRDGIPDRDAAIA